LCNRAAECFRVHVVREAPPSVDLDDRDPLAVLGLETGIAVDRDLLQLEAELFLRGADDAPSRRAQMAAGGRVEDDLGYG
jgi:hypothetical protein